MRRFQSKHAGFTLIELAVVTAIIGLLVAGAVASFGAIRTNTKIKETHRAMHSAELLLRSFIARNGRLPCPGDPTLNLNVAADAAEYGRENDIGGPGTGCQGNRIAGTTVYWGNLPARDMGAESRELADGWGNHLYYVMVSGAAVTDSLTSGTWASDGGVSEVELWDKADDDATLPARQRITDVGVVALISAGPNGSGAYTLEGSRLLVPVATALAENDNQDADIFFVSSNFSEDEATPFDDVVRVYTEEDLVLPLAEMGQVQTKTALTLERMARILDVIYGFGASDDFQQVPDSANPATGIQGSGANGVPWADLSLTRAAARDAWGQDFSYTVHAQREICAPDGTLATSTNDLFTLASTANPALSITHTRNEAVGRLNPGITIDTCP